MTSSSSPPKGLYDPRAFFTHAASLRQGFPHCARFPTAASRRSLARVSVPVWRTVLSDPLPVVATAGRHPAVKLMGRGPLPGRRSFQPRPCGLGVIRYQPPFRRVVPVPGAGWPRVTHPCAALLDPEGSFALDLHVLGVPPAFVLSQDQTLVQMKA